MLENLRHFRDINQTVLTLLEKKSSEYASIIKYGNTYCSFTGYDSWNGGVDYYKVVIETEINIFMLIEDRLAVVEKELLNEYQLVSRDIENEYISELIIKPAIQNSIDWSVLGNSESKGSLLKKIDKLKSIMISVATNGPRIQTINDEYKQLYMEVERTLNQLKLENPNPYSDLWQWHGRWKSGDLPSYQSRREFIGKMFAELLSTINKSKPLKKPDQDYELTGWLRVDRTVFEMRRRIKEAITEEQFQAIGLLSREAIISLAQAVYDPQKHSVSEEITPSKTDAKRMLEAFINIELPGSTNEATRKYTKAALTLANSVTHKRSATKNEARLCLIATMSLVNIIKIVSSKQEILF